MSPTESTWEQADPFVFVGVTDGAITSLQLDKAFFEPTFGVDRAGRIISDAISLALERHTDDMISSLVSESPQSEAEVVVAAFQQRVLKQALDVLARERVPTNELGPVHSASSGDVTATLVGSVVKELHLPTRVRGAQATRRLEADILTAVNEALAAAAAETSHRSQTEPITMATPDWEALADRVTATERMYR